MTKRLLVATIVAAAIAAILIASLTGGASAASTSTPQTEKPLTMTEVRDTALAVAAKSGEMVPSPVEATSGTLGQAAQAFDPDSSPPAITDPRTGRPWSQSSVEIVTMHGHFTYDGPLPKGSTSPTGTVLSLAIDTKSGVVVSQVLSNVAVNLDQINPAVANLDAAQ